MASRGIVIISLTSALDQMRGQRHDLSSLPRGKRPGTRCIRGWVSTRTGLDGCRKSRHNRFLFLISLYSVLNPYFFLCLTVLHFTFCLSLQHTNIHAPSGIRTRNPRKRPVAGHWNRQEFDPRTVYPVGSRYTDCAIQAHLYTHKYVNKIITLVLTAILCRVGLQEFQRCCLRNFLLGQEKGHAQIWKSIYGRKKIHSFLLKRSP